MRAQVWLALGLAAAFAMGCTGDGDAPGAEPGRPSAWEPKSGTRLQARYLVGEDGSRVWGGWFDTARNEPCRVARAEGGRYSCFPEANRAVFRDNRCREPVAEHLACAHRYTAVVRGDSRCGNDTMSVWEEGEALPEPSTAFRLVNDFCSGPEPARVGKMFALTGRVADTALVRGSTELSRPDLRIGPRMVRFEDGALAPLDLHDGGRSKGCVRVDTAKGIRCLPENVLYLGRSGPYYSDQTCSVPVAHADAPACLNPVLALRMDRDGGGSGSGAAGCFRATAAYRVAPLGRLDPRQVFSGSTCEGNKLLPGHFYDLGEPVDLETFPALKVMENGTGRIRVRTYAAADGVTIPPLGQHLYDSQLQHECRLASAADGKLRCLPLDGPAVTTDQAAEGTAFADAACSRPLARHDDDAGPCAGPMPATTMVARVSRRQCLDPGATGNGSRDDREPGRWEIFKLGARHEGEIFFSGAGQCQPGARAGGQSFYELGERVTPESFVAFNEG